MTVRDFRVLAKEAVEPLEANDRIGFVAAVTALVAAKAPLTTGWKTLAQPLMQYGELDLARDAMALYVRGTDDAPLALFDQALALAQMGFPADAMHTLDQIARMVPDRVNNAYLRGTLALNAGDLVAARAALLEAHAARPLGGQIMQTLSMLGSMRGDAELRETILAAERQMLAAVPSERAAYAYALGKTLDDVGEYDRAFAAFAAGAAIIARERPYDRTADMVNSAKALDGWNRTNIDEIATQVTIPTARPIIVTGLPRSGSTLVEQIIVSHSQVADGEELSRFSLVVSDVGSASAAALTRWLQTHAADDAAGLYLRLVDQRFGTGNRFVDKTLEASRYLGMLAALLPEAPILWMRRDPLDNAWSCFSTYFVAGLAWTWDQRALARHMRLEDELLARWQQILGKRLKIVDYDALVADKVAVIPSIFAHCALSVEPQVFSPEKTDRLVTTASVSQVRAPITARAIGKGHRYAEYMQPFLETYHAR